MVITYIGFVVAILILLWGVLIVSRRYLWRGTSRPESADVWIPLKTNELHPLNEPAADEDEPDNEALKMDLHTRAQQNGHYSESKKSL
ncbi:MAG TPA: hypothetical protein VKY19_12850 [Ktedonosporobacter sp.]|jgi:hypothetical protein|nr:hypothetical protein [Ktedonosporobacter sp.]